MANPVSGQLTDTFIMRFDPGDDPVGAGILVDSNSKDREYQYNDPDTAEVHKWYVGFCYIVGSRGAKAFTQAITRTSGPGPASLAGTFDPTVPAVQVEDPPQSGFFFPADTRPTWVHFGNLQGNAPNEPSNLNNLTGDARITVYSGTIGITENSA